MATKTFTGTLSQAMDSLAAEGNKIIFIPQQTVGDVLTGASSIMTVDSDGSYSVKLSYNTYSIYHYSDVSKRKIKIGNNIVVAADTTAETLSDLISSATGELTSDEVLAIQGYLEDAETYATAAASSYTDTAALFDDFDDNVLDVVGEIHTETPALSIPFNESGKLDYGYGTEYVSGLPVYSVDFSRSTTENVINKSGVLEDLSVDEISVGLDGAWLHDTYTNVHPYGNNLYNWSVGSANVISSGYYAGTTMYLVSDTGTTSNDFVGYLFSSTLSAETSYYLQFLVKNVDAELTTITLQGAMDSTLSIDITWDGADISSITGEKSYRKIADDVYLIVSDAKATSLTTGNVSNYVFPSSFVSGGTTTGSVYVGGMMVIQSDDPKELPLILTDGAVQSVAKTSCTVPINGNLPAAGESFTIVCDGSFPKTVASSTLFQIGETAGGTGVRCNGSFALPAYQTESGVYTGTGVANDSEVHRFCVCYDSSDLTYKFYVDGVIISETQLTEEIYYSNDGDIYLGSRANGAIALDSQLKNFKAYHYAADAAEVASWGGAE